MSNYLFVYRAPRDYEGGGDVPSAWGSWFAELGANLLDMGNPTFDRRTIGGGSAETVLGGYSVVAAESLDEAAQMARGCPFLALGGGVEVGELTLLDPKGLLAGAENDAASAAA